MVVIRSNRLGPALLAFMGPLCAYLCYWLPLYRDRVYPPEFDTRIGFLIAGFAPLTTGSAALAVYGYIRLMLVQRTSPTATGRGLLALFLLPVCTSACIGIYLA